MTRGVRGLLVAVDQEHHPSTGDRGVRPGRSSPSALASRPRSGTDLPRGWLGWVVVSVPTLLGLVLAPSVDGRSALDAVAVASQFALLAAAVGFAALQHQVLGSRAGWLSAALTVPPVSVSLVTVVAAVDPQLITIEGYAALHLAGGALSLCCVVSSGSRRRAPAAPVVAGFLGGAATAAVAVGASLSTTAPPPSGPAWTVVLVAAGCVLACLGLLAVRSLHRQVDLGAWVRGPLIAGGGVLIVSAAVSTVRPDADSARYAATALHVVAWICFLVVGVRLLSRVGAPAAARRPGDGARRAPVTPRPAEPTRPGEPRVPA